MAPDRSRSALDGSSPDDYAELADAYVKASRELREERAQAADQSALNAAVLATSHDAGMKRVLQTGDGRVFNKRLELTALHRDGTEFPVDMTITPLRLGGAHRARPRRRAARPRVGAGNRDLDRERAARP